MAPPIAPANLVATAITASRIDLRWDDLSLNELNFELERSPNGTTGWTLINSPAANATTYSNTGLATNTTYYYRIRAVNNDGNSAYSNTASALTLLVGRAPITPRMYLLQPAVVLAARVNVVAATYPLDVLSVDGVTAGSVVATKAGMTLLLGSAAGLDDYGRGRIRSDGAGASLFVGRSSYGTHDGELSVVDNAYVTVWNDRRVWAKIPYLTPAGVIFKDSNLAVEWRTTTPPPVANCGQGFAATIDSVTGLITVLFNGINSFAVATGATITGYLWDIAGGTLTVGTLTSNNITATFPAGFRYVSLTVTDSNGKTHTAYCPVYARNPAADTSFNGFQIESHRVTEQGQTMSVRALADMPRATYPDGTLAMIWEFEPTGTADRNHMLIIGWLDTENTTSGAGKYGLQRDTTLTILDVAARLDTLPGFPQSLADDASRVVGTTPAITWNYMTTPNLYKYIHYLLQWHSTALDVADFIFTGTATAYPFVLLSSDGDSLWNQVDRRARAFVPDRVLTCDRAGTIRIVPDPMLADVAARTAIVQAAIDENEWSDIRFTYQRAPRAHWLRAGAVLTGSTQPIGTVFSIAPGDTPGQGVGEMTQGEQLAISQAALNAATGHRYARANSRLGLLTITLVQNDSAAGSVAPWRELEPAWKEWVTITMSATTAAQRGLTFTAAKGLPKEINVRYNHTKTGLARTIDLTLEIETVGVAGQTVVKPTVPAVGVQPAPVVWVPPVDGDPAYFYGNIGAYVLWDDTDVLRTMDLQAASPVWARVDTGITGSIIDGQYVHVDADTVGMWLLTSTAVFWCADILATTPSWTSKLAIATVIAAEVAHPVAAHVFKSMYNYASEPGYLIVVTGPNVNDSTSDTYEHAYFWHTHDYGQNWTQVDMNAFISSRLGTLNGFYQAGPYALNIFRSAPGTIYALRHAPRVGTTSTTAVFKSVDLGHTWTQEYTIAAPTRESDVGGLLNPFPAANDPTYLIRNAGSTAELPKLYKSTDEWDTGAALTTPSGYVAASGRWRPNKRTFDNTHILCWWKRTDGKYDLLESFDQGASWSLLYSSGASDAMASVCPYNTPNGWPPDVEQWVVVRSFGALSATTIQLTLDKFATLLDKQGNLSSVLSGGAWGNGHGNGFALPKVS